MTKWIVNIMSKWIEWQRPSRDNIYHLLDVEMFFSQVGYLSLCYVSVLHFLVLLQFRYTSSFTIRTFIR